MIYHKFRISDFQKKLPSRCKNERYNTPNGCRTGCADSVEDIRDIRAYFTKNSQSRSRSRPNLRGRDRDWPGLKRPGFSRDRDPGRSIVSTSRRLDFYASRLQRVTTSTHLDFDASQLRRVSTLMRYDS